MDNIKDVARAAKQRMKNNFWAECKRNLDADEKTARERGLSESKIKASIRGKVQKEINGEKQDEFYLKVKALLDSEGEVSDAIGRLTDKETYNSLSYEEKQRYTLKLSNLYLQALEKYKREKETEL